MRSLLVSLLGSAALSCTMNNPAFEGGDEFAEGETRESLDAGDTTTKPDSESGSADVESDDAPTSSSSVDGDGDADPTTVDVDTDPDVDSSSESASSSSDDDGMSSSSSSDDGMSSSSSSDDDGSSSSSSDDDGSSSSSTDDGDSSTTLVQFDMMVAECILVEPLDDCLACAADLCCEEAPPNCFEPQLPCGCMVKCLLGNGNQCALECGMVLPADSQNASLVDQCAGSNCNAFCL
jgi:hypothetical protein